MLVGAVTDKNGDFDDWCTAEYQRVLSSVLVMCAGDVQRAEDATNDAFVTAFEKWDRVSGMTSPRAWVTKVAINRAKRSYRLARRHVPIANDDIAVATVVAEIDGELWAAIERLTLRQRTAIVLRYVEGLPQTEVASELAIAVGTAAATLHQARGKLRVELEGEHT